jgi:LysR family transcriptional regulator for bpeEF and oprC
MSQTMGRVIVMPRLPQFVRRYPDLRLECFLLTNVQDMHATGVDLLLRAGEPPESGVIARKLMQVKIGIYASPKYLKVAGEPVRPEALRQHRCLVYKPPYMGKPLDTWECERGGERRTVIVPSTILSDEREGLMAAAVEGAGITRAGIFDPSLVRTGILRKLLVDWNWLGRPNWYAIYRRTPSIPTKIAVFLDFVKDALIKFDPDELTIEHGTKLTRE